MDKDNSQLSFDWVSDDNKNDDLGKKTKVCIKCKKNLPEDEFRKRGGENYKRTECKDCDGKLRRVRAELRAKHGKAPKDHECPICKRVEQECAGEGSKRSSAWVLDHCHDTGQFRDWICHKCNRGLGAFNLESIERAYEYLKQGKNGSV
jgi:hypothetical protein